MNSRELAIESGVTEDAELKATLDTSVLLLDCQATAVLHTIDLLPTCCAAHIAKCSWPGPVRGLVNVPCCMS